MFEERVASTVRVELTFLQSGEHHRLKTEIRILAAEKTNRLIEINIFIVYDVRASNELSCGHFGNLSGPTQRTVFRDSKREFVVYRSKVVTVPREMEITL